jgi:hypothetical protein
MQEQLPGTAAESNAWSSCRDAQERRKKTGLEIYRKA